MKINIVGKYFYRKIIHIKEHDDGYDMVEYEETNDETGNIYGEIAEDLELQTIDNPYYGGEVDMDSVNNRGNRNNPNNDKEEIITATSNIYYGL